MNPLRCTVPFLFLVLLLPGCSRDHRLSTASPEALRAYEDGVALWQKFYYVEARDSLKQALRHDSTFAMAWMRLAVIDDATANEPEAQRNIARAMHYAKGASPRERLVIAMWDRSIHFDKRGAAALADSIIALYPDEKEIYVFRGGLYEEAKNLEAAIRLYHKATEIDTGYAFAVMKLGYAYSTVGEQEKALDLMRRYIRLAPDAADPRASYADLLLFVGRYDEALEQYRASLSLKPDYWYSVGKIGEIYLVKGRLRDAEQQLLASLRLLPKTTIQDVLENYWKGNVSLLRGDYAGAEALLRKAVTNDTGSAGPAFRLTVALCRQKKFREAREVMEHVGRALERRNMGGTQTMAPYYLYWSLLLTEEGDLKGALASCDSALGFTSVLSRGAVYRQMAEILRREKAYEEALDACSEALAVNPNLPDALLTLARIYHDRRDAAMIQEIGRRLLDFWKDADPDFVPAREVRVLLGRAGGPA